jgi:transcription elongation factor Elf1
MDEIEGDPEDGTPCPICGSDDTSIARKAEIGGPTDILICGNCGEWTNYPGPGQPRFSDDI